jgi:hypothetical protein
VLAAITERPRSGAPRRLTPDQEQVLVTLAYTDPPAGHPHWTLQLLADKVVELGLADAISDETVRRTLKKMTPSPGSARRG